MFLLEDPRGTCLFSSGSKAEKEVGLKMAKMCLPYTVLSYDMLLGKSARGPGKKIHWLEKYLRSPNACGLS